MYVRNQLDETPGRSIVRNHTSECLNWLLARASPSLAPDQMYTINVPLIPKIARNSKKNKTCHVLLVPEWKVIKICVNRRIELN